MSKVNKQSLRSSPSAAGLKQSLRSSPTKSVAGLRRFILAFLVAFGTILALVCFELILRFTLPEPENLAKLSSSSLFLFENKPGATFPVARSGEFNNLVTINSYGFRDDEFKREKEEGTTRIAVLGDSQEEAMQVPLDLTWQKVMARRLELGLGKRVETYNFGVNGYGTDQEWLILTQKVWQFVPDMVILAFSPNDVGDTYKNELVRIKDSNEQFLRSSPASPDAGLKNRLVRVREGEIEIISPKERAGGNFLGKALRETYMYHMMAKAAGGWKFSKLVFEKARTRILGFTSEERFFLSDAQLVQGPFEVIASQKNPPIEVAETWEVVGAMISDMARQAGEHGAKFLVTINIPRAQVREPDWIYLRDLYHLDAGNSSSYEINEVLAGIVASFGVDFYDPRLDAIEWRNRRGDLHFEQDAHFNENGNEFMGTKVAEYILGNNLIN